MKVEDIVHAQDLTQNRKIARLAQLTRELVQSRTPEDTLRILERGFAEVDGFVASLLLSTRGLSPGQLRSGEQKLELPLLATAEGVEALTPIRLLSLAGEPASAPTWLKAGWTPEGIHLDILCFERSMNKIRAVCSAHDQAGLSDDDCVEVFLNPEPKDARKSYHYIVNSRGAIWDGRIGFGIEAGEAWSGTARARASVEPKRWRVRLTIPFTDLGIAQPAPGLAVRVNVYRTRWASGSRESSAWSPTNEPDYSVSNRYGILVLRGEHRPGAESEARGSR